MTTSNKNVLDQLERNAQGEEGVQELFYNARNGRFEVMAPAEGAANPDVVVAPYNEQGFFC